MIYTTFYELRPVRRSYAANSVFLVIDSESDFLECFSDLNFASKLWKRAPSIIKLLLTQGSQEGE